MGTGASRIIVPLPALLALVGPAKGPCAPDTPRRRSDSNPSRARQFGSCDPFVCFHQIFRSKTPRCYAGWSPSCTPYDGASNNRGQKRRSCTRAAQYRAYPAGQCCVARNDIPSDEEGFVRQSQVWCFSREFGTYSNCGVPVIGDRS